jgi:stage V sporulation protein SpoVS
MLTSAEYHMKERVPLAAVHEAIFEFCRDRADVVIFGAQAVNQYVSTPRMTQDVDLLSPTPKEVAEALARWLQERTRVVAAHVREVRAGVGYRVYQTLEEGTRHLADVRLAVFPLDDSIERDGVRYTAPAVTMAMKVCALVKRRLAPKGATDLADLRRLVLAHPELRTDAGLVADAIVRVGGGPAELEAWRELCSTPIVSDEDVDEGY